MIIDPETLDFFNKNKDLKYIPPTIPSNLDDPFKIAQWITNNPDFAWLELDINFNLENWKNELQYAEPYYVPHRESKSNGWVSCCLHGIDTDKTGHWVAYVDKETEDLYQWTKISEKTPNIKNFWKNTFPSQTYNRIRFMKVKSQGYIGKHNDSPGQGWIPGETSAHDPIIHGCPINIALVHPDNCYMVLEGFGIVPFKEGKIFLVNIRHNHSVINFSDQDRIHMIGFAISQNRQQDFAELITRSYLTQHERK